MRARGVNFCVHANFGILKLITYDNKIMGESEPPLASQVAKNVFKFNYSRTKNKKMIMFRSEVRGLKILFLQKNLVLKQGLRQDSEAVTD